MNTLKSKKVITNNKETKEDLKGLSKKMNNMDLKNKKEIQTK